VQRYRVRFGFGGLGKTREGDRKTPLGTYALDAPRASAKYGTFIGLGYPTEAQRAAGYTGSAVGVHGPGRSSRWLGRVSTWFDTTDGCIALGTDEEMDALAAWVREAGARSIVIE
jgi:murein L,D-transpeptidase YafK